MKMNTLIKIALLLFTITLFACGGGSSGGGSAAVTPPTITKLTIANAQANEGENITFKVIANPAIAEPITFDYRIDFESQTASADDLSSDISGRSTIAASSDSTTISILIKDDDINEPAETFRIVLSNLAPAGAIFTKNTALGTISASDPTEIRISGAAGNEGGMINFKVIATPPIAKQITFTFEATLDNKATNPASISDLSGELTGTSTIDANNTTATISIATANDNLRENAETFLVMLSNLSPTSDVTFGDNEAIGTILANDDATGIVVIKVADAKATEDSGTINFKVTSEFSAATGSPFTFGYEVDLDNSSADTDDFDGATNGTATIDASSTTIAIKIATDDTIELNETFRFLITNPSANATIDSAKNSAIGTILNDDLGEISDATAIIGDGEITLNWANPDSNIFAEVVISQTTSTDAPLDCASATNVTIIDAQQKTSDTIEGLTNGTAYSFRICAKSNDGSISSGVTLPNLIPQPTVDNNGNGLIDIATATELNNMRHNLDATSLKTSSTAFGFSRGCPTSGCNGYELISDITLSGAWTPIGTFTKIFDGKDKTISGLRISTTDSNIGLFSAMQDATILNLKLANVSVTGAGNVGALVGSATDTTLSNIELIGDASQESSNAEIKGTGGNVGGLAGVLSGGAISDASSSLTVRGGVNDTRLSEGTGGLVGLNGKVGLNNARHLVIFPNSGGTISNSGASGNVTGRSTTGGLVGQNAGAISNSWASGNVSGNGNNYFYRGGLVGRNEGAISQSWASGNVTGIGSNNFYYGGLVGDNSNNTANIISDITQSWASGNVTGTGAVGGLVGRVEIGRITQSWASGSVASTGPGLGGLVGTKTNGSIIGRNYQLDDAIGVVDLANDDGIGNSFVLGDGTGNDATGLRDLKMLSGENIVSATSTSDWQMNSGWHAGFDISNPSSTTVANFDLETMFCDTNADGTIDTNEQVATNSVWVMAPAANNVTTDTNEAGDRASYYQIPAIRCIGDTKGKTPTEINAIRQREIDRQRRLFPR